MRAATSSSSTSCTSARSRPRARSTAAIAHLPRAGRARRHRGRADAGRDVPRRARLGLRRRPHLGAAPRLRRPRRPRAPRRRRPRGRARRDPRRRLQPRRRRARELLAAFGPYFTDTYAHVLGRRDRLRRSRRCASGRSRTPSCGSRDYRIDGLRLDAMHAIFDDEPEHVMAELAERVRALSPDVLVISEMELDDPGAPITRVGPRRAVGRRAPPRAARPAHGRARRLLRSAYRQGRRPRARRVPRHRGRDRSGFVVCAQNHDQVGNRALGDRLPARRAPLAALCTLLSPEHAAALHGRGVRRGRAVPVLHRPHRPGDRRRDARGPAQGVRAASPPSPARRCPTRRTLATFERSKLTRRGGRPRAARVLRASCIAPAPRAAARGSRPTRTSERRILRVRRGDVELVAELRATQTDGAARADWRCASESGPARRSRSGATWDGEGTNFSLFSENAERVELCLFDDDGNESAIELTRAHRLQLALLPARASARASATATASTARTSPSDGHRFNPTKLLIDPYAKAIEGPIDWDAANVLPYVPEPARTPTCTPTTRTTPRRSRSASSSTSASTGRTTARRARPWSETVIYELHVKGFTKLQRAHPRGPARHLRRARLRAGDRVPRASLGVTAVELLPIHHIADEELPAPSAGSRTTGATARSASSRRTRSTPRPAAAASRCASSRGWSRRCTAPASR